MGCHVRGQWKNYRVRTAQRSTLFCVKILSGQARIIYEQRDVLKNFVNNALSKCMWMNKWCEMNLSGKKHLKCYGHKCLRECNYLSQPVYPGLSRLVEGAHVDYHMISYDMDQFDIWIYIYIIHHIIIWSNINDFHLTHLYPTKRLLLSALVPVTYFILTTLQPIFSQYRFR